MSPIKEYIIKVKLAILTIVAFALCNVGSTLAGNNKLAEQARQVALHGGITGTCHGCATAQMQYLMDKVYAARFKDAGSYAQQRALCIMHRESGGNPGAISNTGDYGGPQMNYVAHHYNHPEWYQPGRGFRYLIFDPWLGASEMFAMSRRGTSWSLWNATVGGC